MEKMSFESGVEPPASRLTTPVGVIKSDSLYVTVRYLVLQLMFCPVSFDHE